MVWKWIDSSQTWPTFQYISAIYRCELHISLTGCILSAGCLYDGKVYSAGDVITIQPCLAQMTCQGYNSYSYPKSLG